MKLIALIFLICFFCACKENPGKEILPPDKMQAVLWDYLKADVYTTDFIVPDTMREAQSENIRLQQLIFEKHKVSKEQFYNSYDYYLKNPAQMTTMLDSMMAVEARLHTQKRKTDTFLRVSIDSLSIE